MPADTAPTRETLPDREAARAALRRAEAGLQRAQSVAYYAHRRLLESRSPDAAAGYRAALAGCREAVDALVRADAALQGLAH